MTDEIKRIALNGVELGYSIHGGGPDRPPLVFVHGYAMRSTAGPYAALLDRLGKRFAVYALDLRGHGASADAVAGWTQEALADDLVAFTRALKLQAPVFVAHSFGAVIGLLAELRHPGAFSAVCLLSPGPADHRSDPPDALKFMIEHGHDRTMLSGGFARMFAHPPGDLLAVTLDAVTLVDSEVHRAHQELNPQFSIDDALKNVSAPTLLVCGEGDVVVAPALQHDMARKLARCKQVVFSGEGHMLPIEKPASAAHEILSFVDHDV